MDGHQFEYACASILRSKGFSSVKVTKASGDQGVDIIAHKGGHKYAIQCKLYSKPVGNSAVQQVYAGAAYYGCDRCIVMTNNDFTKSARDLAGRTGVQLMPFCQTTSIIPKINWIYVLNAAFAIAGIGSIQRGLNTEASSFSNISQGILYITAGMLGIIGWNVLPFFVVSGLLYLLSFGIMIADSLLTGNFQGGELIFLIIPLGFFLHAYKLAIISGKCVDYKKLLSQKVNTFINNLDNKINDSYGEVLTTRKFLFPIHSVIILLISGVAAAFYTDSVMRWLLIVAISFMVIIMPLDILTVIYIVKKSDMEKEMEPYSYESNSVQNSTLIPEPEPEPEPEISIDELRQIASTFEVDSYLAEAVLLVAKNGKASIGIIQRTFKVGFNRADRIMNQLHLLKIVGEEDGYNPRKVLVHSEESSHCAKVLSVLSDKSNYKRINRASD